MRNEIINMDASIKARLKNIAKEYKKTFNLILPLYMQERLLYRLSISEYKDNFILKGGLLLFLMSGFTGRPTRDIDFLAYQISNDMKNIKEVFRKICKVEYNDGIVFNSNSVSVEEAFKRRGTDILKFSQVFKKEFIEDNHRINQWKLFLKKIGHQNIEFEYVMDAIKKSLLPVYNNIKKEKE